MPVTAFSFPRLRGMVFQNDSLYYKWEEYAMARSQDLEEIYHDCGQFYWCKTKEFLENSDFLSNHTVPFTVSELEVQDIDNETDWKLAELKYQMIRRS